MASKTPLLQPAQGTSAWNEPLNANFQTVTNAIGNIQSVSVSSGYALNSTEAVNLGFILTGSLGSALDITIPNSIVGSWIVVNSTSGAGSITFKTVGGTGVQLSAGATILYSDGTNVYSAIAGSGASFLPTSGGTISGNLAVTGTLGVTGTSTLGDTTIPAGKTFTIASGATFALNGAFSPSFISLGGSQVSPYLLTLTGVAAGGTMAYMNGLVTIPSGAGNGLQIGTSDGLSGNRLVVNGTSNFIGNVTIPGGNTLTISGGSSTGTVRLNVTGDASISGTLTAGLFSPSVLSVTGNITSTTGNITASAGTISGQTVSFGTGGLTSTTGAMNLTSGAVTHNVSGLFNFKGTPQIWGSGLNLLSSSGIFYSGVTSGASNWDVINSSTAVSFRVLLNNTGVQIPPGATYGNYSDVSLKENIETIKGAVDKIKAIRGVYYTLKDNPNAKKKIGFIAQEVMPFIPEVVFKNEGDEHYSMGYSEITAVLVNAIKELDERSAAIEAKLP